MNVDECGADAPLLYMVLTDIFFKTSHLVNLLSVIIEMLSLKQTQI